MCEETDGLEVIIVHRDIHEVGAVQPECLTLLGRVQYYYKTKLLTLTSK